MPRIRSAKKRMRQAKARTERNRAQRSAIKTAVKKARAATSKETVAAAVQVLDRGARKGLIHRNAAARKKARLLKRLRSAK
ncbi:MAG TPA: 30S ribosomal protein S20 [Gemmatimonadales bacterium]|nr:30S ribosomal protein S20 [Gemmatimonadales bacterium]